MTENTGYYAVIPASVRYDKALQLGARLLFGEITALCNAKGFCWATNEYFKTLYGTSDDTITRWISSLVRGGYIRSDFDKYANRRCISLLNASSNAEGYPQNCGGGIRKNADPRARDIIIENNTMNNIYKEYKESSPNEDPSREKAPSVGASPTVKFVQEVISYLNETTGSKYKPTVEKNKELILARKKEGFTLEDFKNVIEKKAAEWGKSEMSKYLRPTTLFGTKFEGYLNEKKQTAQPQETKYKASDFFDDME